MSQLKIFDLPETKPECIHFISRSPIENYELINTLWDNIFIGTSVKFGNILVMSFRENKKPYQYQQIYSMP